MATSTELLHAAEHMRKWAESIGVDFPWRSIEAQGKRLQDIECKEIDRIIDQSRSPNSGTGSP